MAKYAQTLPGICTWKYEFAKIAAEISGCTMEKFTKKKRKTPAG
jgi:hypothetical protein